MDNPKALGHNQYLAAFNVIIVNSRSNRGSEGCRSFKGEKA
jgi:hypothetical protein